MLPEWSVRCTLSFGGGVEAFPHLLHSWKFSTLWNLCCLRRCDFWVKSLPHSVHLSGFSWVWVRCCVRDCLWLKTFVHWLPSQKFSAVWKFLQLALEDIWMNSWPGSTISSGCFVVLFWFWRFTSKLGFKLLQMNNVYEDFFVKKRGGASYERFPQGPYTHNLSLYSIFSCWGKPFDMRVYFDCADLSLYSQHLSTVLLKWNTKNHLLWFCPSYHYEMQFFHKFLVVGFQAQTPLLKGEKDEIDMMNS